MNSDFLMSCESFLEKEGRYSCEIFFSSQKRAINFVYSAPSLNSFIYCPHKCMVSSGSVASSCLQNIFIGTDTAPLQFAAEPKSLCNVLQSVPRKTCFLTLLDKRHSRQEGKVFFYFTIPHTPLMSRSTNEI